MTGLKTILCYGDSNTWGYNPRTQDRFTTAERWTGVLTQELGAAFRIVEEGLNGRTTVWDDPIEGYKNGKEYLIPCLESHRPIDLVVIMLGTNDLKTRFSVSAYDIAQSVAVLVDLVQRSTAGPAGGAPRVLLVAPPVVGKLTGFAEMFEDAQAKSAKFSEYYRNVADLYRCEFLDAAQVIVSSELDGIHFEADQHQKLGKAVAVRVKEIFKHE
jgi:lysophospholipase L1-like esterase